MDLSIRVTGDVIVLTAQLPLMFALIHHQTRLFCCRESCSKALEALQGATYYSVRENIDAVFRPSILRHVTAGI